LYKQVNTQKVFDLCIAEWALSGGATVNLNLEKDFFFLMEESEKRLFKRVEVGLDVELLIDGHPVQATTANISCGGLFLKIDPEEILEASRREDVCLMIHLPNRHRPVEMVAEILRRENDHRQGLALRFQGLYTDNILAIEQFIKSSLH